MSDLPSRPRQLALDLPVESRHGIEDFLIGPSNETAYGLVESWPNWPESWLRLVGPEGAGKTHLAAIWAKVAHAWTVSVAEVTQEDVPHLISGGALVVEDCDQGVRDEPALFHLMNAMKAKGGFLLLTARSAPDLWGLRVPDLLSRLRLAPQATIAPPDDAGIIEMLALRMERSFAAARALVDALDRLSLERGRRVTRALATEALAALFPAE
jgi:chromosomal replication initiation ATPase DnaA